VTCSVGKEKAVVEAGFHPSSATSCAKCVGVTLGAVGQALRITARPRLSPHGCKGQRYLDSRCARRGAQLKISINQNIQKSL
jgi:hypothetical protein